MTSLRAHIKSAFEGKPAAASLRPAFLCLFLWGAVSASAGREAPADSSAIELEEVEVSASPSSHLGRGAVRYSPKGVEGLARVLGEADIVNHIKQLPGIAVRSDYGSGISVDGAEPSQTLFRLSGIPVFFPYRFGGIFSTFNTPHFASARFERTAHDAAMPNRLGGMAEFEPAVAPGSTEKFGGTVNAGLLSSSATLKIPAGKRLSIAASGRVSYIDEIYGPFLRQADNSVAYRFYDFNLSASYAIDSLNTIYVNGFYSRDRLVYSETRYAIDTRLKWHNALGGIEWRRAAAGPSGLSMRHRVFYTDFSDRLGLIMPQFGVITDAGIAMAGISGNADFRPSRKTFFKGGYELGLYRVSPQRVRIDGIGEEPQINSDRTERPTEARIYGDLRYDCGHGLEIEGGLSLTAYHNPAPGKSLTSFAADPRVSISYRRKDSETSLHYGIYHQYLHRVGFSEIGLASDFWIGASAMLPGQTSHTVALDYSHNLDRLLPGLRAEAGVYFKKVSRQPEYDGTVLEVAASDYEAADHIIISRGFNLGGHAAIIKEAGNLSGSLHYSYGAARRHYPGESGLLRGLTDAGHRAGASATYRFNRRWSAGATFSYATGRPYTPVKSIYVIAGSVIREYGRRNSGNFPPYHRLDLWATYKFAGHIGRHRLSQQVNLSIINAYGHKNVEMSGFALNGETGRYRRRYTYSLYRFLPSLSYTVTW